MVKTQAGREPVFLSSKFSLTLYQCATPTHDIIAKLLVSKKAFCHSKVETIYEVQEHLPQHKFQKEYFLNCQLLLFSKIFPNSPR
jgi:hypothetical protein